MSFRRQQPMSRRQRRQLPTGRLQVDPTRLDLPGPLRIMTNRKVFVTVAVVMAVAIVVSLFLPGVIGNPIPSDEGVVRQANELPDMPHQPLPDGSDAPAPSTTATIKRYTSPPPMVIDPSKRYTATIKTTQGDIQVELYPDQAPEAVNTFVFLAGDGYYDGTRWMQVAANADGSRFTAQAGDPTGTGLGTPGFDVKDEQTSLPFVRGALGMDEGQFFISYGDYPALNGKYTLFGKVTSGMDVLERLTLLDVRANPSGSADSIQSIEISAN